MIPSTKKIFFNSFPEIICILKKKSIFIVTWNDNNYMCLSLNIENVNHININAKCLNVRNLDSNMIKLVHLWNKKLYLINRIFFTKLKLKGKGFRIQSFKQKKIINYTFGHSHMYISRLQNLFYKRLTKHKYIIYSPLKSLITDFRLKANFVKPLNMYTLRGLKLSKKILVKRKGRKSPNL